MSFGEIYKGENRLKERKKENIVEFTPDEFVKILESPKFLEALSIASQKTKKTGYETSFNVNVIGDRKIYIPEVNQGSTDRMTGSKTIKEMDGEIYFNGENYEKGKGCLIDLHFHPDDKQIIRPSEQDLTHLLLNEGESFMCVARVDKIGNVEILLVSPKRVILREDLEGYESDLPSSYGEQQDINEYLDEFGFDAFTINYEKNKKTLMLEDLSKKEIAKLKNVKVKIEKMDDYNLK